MKTLKALTRLVLIFLVAMPVIAFITIAVPGALLLYVIHGDPACAVMLASLAAGSLFVLSLVGFFLWLLILMLVKPL